MKKFPVICIDIEASGLGPRSYPIEIAWKCSKTHRGDTFLINPDSAFSWTDWDVNAQHMHGLNRDQLLAEGISVQEACKRLNAALAGHAVYCDALEFDYFWIRRLFEAARMRPAFKLRGLESILKGEQLIQYSLVAKTQIRRHRAMDDVEDLLVCIAACGLEQE